MPSRNKLTSSYDPPRGAAFFKVPTTLAALLTALLDPAVIVLTHWLLHAERSTSYSRWLRALSRLGMVFAFYRRLRPARSYAALALELALNWLLLLAMLYLCMVVTRSGNVVKWALLQQWSIATPVVHWCAACGLRAALRRHGLHVRAASLAAAPAPSALG